MRPLYRVWWWGDEAPTIAELPQAFFGSLDKASREARKLARRYGQVKVESVHLVELPRRALLLAALNGLAVEKTAEIHVYTSEACGRCEDCTDGFDGPSCQERVKIKIVSKL